MKRLKRTRRSYRAIHDIPLTPLIDTALTLLVIFMIASPMMHNAIRISLPKGSLKEDKGVQHEQIVTLDEKGQLFLNQTQMKRQELLDDLINKKSPMVFIRADKRIEYGIVSELLNDIKKIDGIKDVVLAFAR
jgi:biopolymer transport protein TolR